MAWLGNCLGFIVGPASSTFDSFIESSTGKALAWVWDLAAGGIASIILLSSMAEKLRREVRHLTDSRTEVLEEVEIGKLENKRLRPSAKTWLEEVGKVVDEAREFQNSFERVEGFSLSSRYELGGKVDKLLTEVSELHEQKGNLVILGEAMPDPVEPQAIPQHKIVGIDENFLKIRRLLDDDNCPIVGIYGMGGIGKTTLLKKLNNDLHETESNQFDIVIFVTVSSNPNIWDIQKAIGNRLGYSDKCGRPLPQDINERKERLLASLLQKKFMLLLDDIWDKLELEEIGIPLSHLTRKGSKIVLTTRSRNVCVDMDVGQNMIEVCLLCEQSSWKLFCEKLGRIREEDWNTSTKSLAKQVVEECGGLPLALITVGSAMASVFTDDDWERELMTLRCTAPELRNMEEKVFIPLKFSYDRLKDKRHKQCLLYCALYPEDFNIKIEELVDYWVGEGFLEKAGDSIHRVRNRGLAAINTLRDVCLLEDGDIEKTPNSVKLHDMIHKMAIWITSEEYEKEETIFLSNPGKNLMRVPALERWSYATKISLSLNSIRELPNIPKCQNLTTLLLANNFPLRQIQGGFLKFMPHLTVLDLSSTRVTCLPSDIGLLHELRFLDLSRNYQLQSLPKEVWGLKKLRMLNINYTKFQIIPREAILLFSSLKSLKIFHTSIEWTGGWNDHDRKLIENNACLKDLDGLEKLEELDLQVSIKSNEDWCGLRNSRSLRSLFTVLHLGLFKIYSFDLVQDFWTPNQLRELSIVNCLYLNHLVFPAKQVTKIEILNFMCVPLEQIKWRNGTSIVMEPSTVVAFKNLKTILFHRLALKEIKWTRKLPCLTSLSLSLCNEMEEMIPIEEPEITAIDCERDSYFPALSYLHIEYMKILKSICTVTLSFPRLEDICIFKCSMVKKLPFQLDSGKKLIFIRGEKTWWNNLQWDDERIQSKFKAYFYEEVR